MVAWKRYNRNRFVKVMDVTPANKDEFPDFDGGNYALAVCILRNANDPNVIQNGVYIIRWYTDPAVKMEAPNPPFQSGDGGV